MFYSRPKIEPLGWDLLDLPAPNGSKHFDAVTSDMRPVDFRFSGGWLTVELGPRNAPPDGPEMEEILSVPISPFGTMDIYAEQLCDILGLTVNGQKIDSAGMHIGARGLDWSGSTTYWQSTHMLDSRDDAREFLKHLRSAFPGSFLIQPEWGAHGRLRCRKIRFLMGSDFVVRLGVIPDQPLLNKVLSGEEVTTEDYESVFAYSMEISRRDHDTEDVTHSRYIQEHGAKEPGLDYYSVHHRRYCVSAEYKTEDTSAQSRTRTMLSVLDGYFCRGLKKVNLQTGAVMEENLRDDEDEKSYSKVLRDRCLEKPKGYLFVGIEGVAEGTASREHPVFFGARPIE